jgi:hypothetical protein
VPILEEVFWDRPINVSGDAPRTFSEAMLMESVRPLLLSIASVSQLMSAIPGIWGIPCACLKSTSTHSKCISRDESNSDRKSGPAYR